MKALSLIFLLALCLSCKTPEVNAQTPIATETIKTIVEDEPKPQTIDTVIICPEKDDREREIHLLRVEIDMLKKKLKKREALQDVNQSIDNTKEKFEQIKE